ncbi:metallophosphoesterase family protein [Ancylobacter lacus]|uniref:metallophosphoesterase family protein n=1 Tax=Ancylobacter lacus TaxID=2579970 RepID=UPI001BCAAD89|nr:metallophosphoesterase [Ancylobacter lacus]
MFVLAHLTDPHLGPLPPVRLKELASKRALGFLNWRRGRRKRFAPGTIELLVDDIKALAPDHIAVTGDLVNVGLPAEYQTGLVFLRSLGAGDKVTVIPGNHDAYVRSTAHHALLNWGEYMRGDSAEADRAADQEAFPFVRRRGDVALVGVSSAIPTNPFMATGRVGRAQLARLAGVLDQLGREGLFRVVMIHHPPCGHRAAHKRLLDAEGFRACLARHGAELVICGHDHRPMVEQLPGPHGLIPVVEAPSAAAGPEDRRWPGGYHLYRIERQDGNAWRCEMEARGFAPGDPTVARRTVRVLAAPPRAPV